MAVALTRGKDLDRPSRLDHSLWPFHVTRVPTERCRASACPVRHLRPITYLLWRADAGVVTNSLRLALREQRRACALTRDLRSLNRTAETHTLPFCCSRRGREPSPAPVQDLVRGTTAKPWPGRNALALPQPSRSRGRRRPRRRRIVRRLALQQDPATSAASNPYTYWVFGMHGPCMP